MPALLAWWNMSIRQTRGTSNLSRAIKEVVSESHELELDNETTMRRLEVKILRAVELCLEVVAWFLLRMPMCEMSQDVIYINTN